MPKRFIHPTFPSGAPMLEPSLSQAPLEPVEALMCIRAIVDATVDRDGSMPLEAAFRLIDIVLVKALPSFRPREETPPDGATPTR